MNEPEIVAASRVYGREHWRRMAIELRVRADEAARYVTAHDGSRWHQDYVDLFRKTGPELRKRARALYRRYWLAPMVTP